MSFRAKVFRCCRNFVFPLSKSMWSKINIYFLFLHRKCSIHKGSSIFHFPFFFAGCRCNYRFCCGYRFTFSMGTIVLANSFCFTSVVTHPSVFNFAPVVTEFFAVCLSTSRANRFAIASCRSTIAVLRFAVATIIASAGVRSVPVAYPSIPVVNAGCRNCQISNLFFCYRIAMLSA